MYYISVQFGCADPSWWNCCVAAFTLPLAESFASVPENGNRYGVVCIVEKKLRAAGDKSPHQLLQFALRAPLVLLAVFAAICVLYPLRPLVQAHHEVVIHRLGAISPTDARILVRVPPHCCKRTAQRHRGMCVLALWRAMCC